MNDGGFSILLIEDDDVAAESVTRSLVKHGVDFPVTWVQDGTSALAVLRDQGPARSLERPRIVLLDLKLPQMNGFEFLAAIRADKQLQDEVVFVLTTSDGDEDRTRAYHANIAGYMVKSAVGPQFAKLARLLLTYGDAVRLP
jgi:CheY-like chemotaxis protein